MSSTRTRSRAKTGELAMRFFKGIPAVCIMLFLAAGIEDAWSDPASLQYHDSEYGFAFQFPAEWRLQTQVETSSLGKVRALVKHPTKPIFFAAVVGQLGTSVSKAAFANNPNSKQIVAGMIDFTIDEVYKKAAQSQNFKNIKVTDTQQVSSVAAIEFYIATFSIFENSVVSMAGLHAVPFEKPYMVSFIEVSPVDPEAAADNDLLRRTFNSFHIDGESPMQ
jgi:hypothetical protein